MTMLYAICLGCNSHRRHNMADARRRLSAAFPGIRFAREEDTPPLLPARKGPFANQVACFRSSLCAERVKQCLKDIERHCGRRPADTRRGIVRMDIDLLLAGPDVCKPADLERDYVCRGLKELGIGGADPATDH